MAEPETEDDDQDEPRTEGNKGKAKRFSLRLTKPKAEDSVETTPFSVSVKEPKKPASYLEAVPYHQDGDDPFPPGAATSFLQIWELDSFAGAGKYLSKAEGDYGESCNRLVGSIPGCVILKDKTFHFRVMAKSAAPIPTRTFHKDRGRILLKLTNTDEEEVELKLNLPEYEGILELAACLAPTAATGTLESVTNASGVTFVHNVQASVHKQLRDRSGIAVSCISKYPDPVSNNDVEMEKQAKQILGNLPTFTVEDGKLRLGIHKISGYEEIPALLAEIRKTAKEELKLEREPKVTTLFLFAHGIRTKLLLNKDGYSKKGSLTAARAPEFVQQLKPHIGSPFVLPLFACNNGRGERAGDKRMQGHGDATYGLALACEIPGYDSLGWHAHNELSKAGIKNTVWAHTTTGHTTRNCRLRVFSSWGVADFASLLYGGRALAPKTRRQYGLQTNYSFANQKPEVAKQKLANANVIRSISTHSALYLDWSWIPGSQANDKDPLWRAQAASEAQEAVKRFKDLMTLFDLAPEEWRYEDKATKAHIVGVSDDSPTQDPKFSKNFSYKELSAKASPFRISVALMKGVQATLTPSASSAAVAEVIENGDGIVLRASSKATRDKLLTQAKVVKGLGLLETVQARGERELLLNTSGVQYDAACEFVIGGPAEAYLTHEITLGDFGECSRIHRGLLLLAQQLMNDVPGTTLVGVDPSGESLYLESDDPDLECQADELEAGGTVDAEKVDERRVKISRPGATVAH